MGHYLSHQIKPLCMKSCIPRGIVKANWFWASLDGPRMCAGISRFHWYPLGFKPRCSDVGGFLSTYHIVSSICTYTLQSPTGTNGEDLWIFCLLVFFFDFETGLCCCPGAPWTPGLLWSYHLNLLSSEAHKSMLPCLSFMNLPVSSQK